MKRGDWLKLDFHERCEWCESVVISLENGDKNQTISQSIREIAYRYDLTESAVRRRLRMVPELMVRLSQINRPKAGQLWREEFIDTIREQAMLGKSQNEIAEVLEVQPKTFRSWIENPQLGVRQAIQDGSTVASGKVVGKLFEAAMGREVEEVKEEWVISEDTGEQVLSKTTRHIKKIPPDTKAMMHWLSIKEPDRWRESKKVEIDSSKLDYSLAKASTASEAAAGYKDLIAASVVSSEAYDEDEES